MSRKRSQRRQHAQRARRAPSVDDKIIDVQTVAARSGASVDEIYDYVEDGLMPGPVRLTGDGVGSGARAWYKYHMESASRIKSVRDAGGGRSLTALKLLVDKLPPSSAAWVRRAVREAFLRYAGGDVTVGQIRKATQQQWDEGRIRQQMRRFPTLSEQDARSLTYEARAFSPTRNPADGMERAKEMHKTGARLTMNRSEEHTSELQSHSDLVCRL